MVCVLCVRTPTPVSSISCGVTNTSAGMSSGSHHVEYSAHVTTCSNTLVLHVPNTPTMVVVCRYVPHTVCTVCARAVLLAVLLGADVHHESRDAEITSYEISCCDLGTHYMHLTCNTT